jgi:hypothetical protein
VKDATAQASKYTVADGSWNTPSVWNNGTVPNTGDTILILNNITYNDSTNFSAALLEIGPRDTLTLNNSTLTVNNLFLNGGTLANSTHNITLSPGALVGIYDSSSIAVTPLGESYNVEYNNTLPIRTGPELQNNSVIGDLIINSIDNVSLNSNATVNGNIIFRGGNLNIGSFTLTLNGGIQTGIFFGSLTGGASSNIILGGSGNSTTLPAITVNNLTLNRANGISLGGNVLISGVLSLISGKLTLGTNNLTLGSSATITGANETKYIVTDGAGEIKRNISNDDAFVLFPVGPTNTSYNPVSIKLDLASTPDVFGVKVSNTIANTPNKPLEVIEKEWSISEETSGGSNATIQYSFASGDFGSGFNPNLIPNVYDIGHYNSGYNVFSGSISNPVSGLYAITSTQKISIFSPFIVGNYNSVTGANVLNFALTALISGNYNGTTMVPKNVLVELHNPTTPYALVDSQTVLLNASGIGNPIFTKGVNEIPYYIVLRTDNCLETWSATPQTSTGSALNYDFTTAATQAFGSNMQLVGTKWCIISGDINQDGSVDALDRSACWNDRNLTGPYTSDLNGDGTVDALDRSICWNNRNLSVQKPALVLSSNSAVNQNNKGTYDNTANSKTKSSYDLKLDGSNKNKVIKQNHYLK